MRRIRIPLGPRGRHSLSAALRDALLPRLSAVLRSLPLLLLAGVLGMAGAAKTVATPVENPTWESLGQNAAQAAQYEALGYDPASAHDLILARFDYSFTAGALIAMIVVVVLYYVLLLRFSETEYREVIAEKFGEK